jgi:hypothetical protein
MTSHPNENNVNDYSGALKDELVELYREERRKLNISMCTAEAEAHFYKAKKLLILLKQVSFK